ncbi:MAG: c-type cytochrome [Pyrinomonadaceae bacterium]
MHKRIITHGCGGVALGLLLGFIFANHAATGARAEVAAHKASDGEPLSSRVEAGDTALPFAMPQNKSVEKPAEQVFKNIQSLKGLPASQLYATMNFMKASLGVKCDHCHVRTADGKWNWESDEKPVKQFTRRMIQLTIESNKIAFNGRTQVSCYTCHRGKTDPVNIPPITAAPEQQQGAASVAAPANAKPQAAAAMPTVDELLNKYTEAVGGKRAIENFKTQFSKGTLTAHLLPTSPLEIYQAAPNKMLALVTTPKGVLLQGFNGMIGWSGNETEAREVSGTALAQLKRSADFYGDWKLKEQFARLLVTGKEKIGEREAYVVGGRTVDNKPERLYFDTQTGLLLRRVSFIDTMVGMIPEVTDYEDYREVDGVKIPFTKRRAQLEGFEASTIKITEIKHNIPIDDAKFAMPAAQK